MSITRCTECGSAVDVDFKEPLIVLCGQRIVCETCMDKDDIWETVGLLQSKLDEKTRQLNNTVKALTNANIELRTVYDSARQGLERQGVSL